MKASSATFAKATEPPRPTGRSSASRRSPTSVEGFSLAGPSDLPDPAHNAYRRDLADAALAGRVIASHYAIPVARLIAGETALKAAPDGQAETLASLAPGEPFEMLDDNLGWAWGYAGSDRRVGYVSSKAIAQA